MTYDSIKQWFLGVIAAEEEQKRLALAPVTIESQPHAEVNGDCPMCHEQKAMREIYQGALRCQACGWQLKKILPRGIPRSQLETFEYPDREHQQKFQRGFNDALWRIRGPQR